MEETTVDNTVAADGQGSDAPVEVANTPEGSEALGDAGKKALSAMKEREKAARARARELEREVAELRATLESKDKTPDEQELDAVRREAEAAAIARANERILRSEIKAAAAGKLADPEDALRYLDLGEFEVDESGNVDATEIVDAINELLERKPYLSAQGGRVTLDTGRGKNPAAGQLTREDLRHMTPEEIVSAKSAGRLNNVLGRS
ncbi:MAG UNVERIFIED_CONTAM: hypothetical protein LOD86_05395 [Thermobifida fusca]